MTANYVAITDGQQVATWAANLNTFGAATMVDIAALEVAVAAKVNIADIGMIEAYEAVPVAQSLTTSYNKVILADTTRINKANGHITYNGTTGVITLVTAGIYHIEVQGAILAPNNSLVTFNYNLNAVDMITTPPAFVGAGTRPVMIGNSIMIDAPANSILYIEAKADSAISMTPTSCDITIEKTHFL